MSGAPLFTLVIFMKVDNIYNIVDVCVSSDFHEGRQIFHHIVDACVEFCFLKEQFLNLTINMQLLYFICDQPSSFSQAPSACGVQCSTERLVHSCIRLFF